MKSPADTGQRKKRRVGMKQIIVLVAMVLLGIAIAGFVLDFSDSAETISGNANEKIVQLTSE
jgi:flagellar basal body-associated protein FliL